ncbi:ATP-dependent DNA ligase (plasmid) [Aminobacter sp. Y103A]|uniref:ATP-dependent DNA ligase n=1 Tax=Aminobacter sp. Y103A TaxID=1870862 RepID=UPI0025732DC1|nr:ATP-dependent DNA ligase [Aminobacter sp. SS-2016]BBD41417.1 ATP-dependent DNA ligase [Aminobacter sp. SS-2016]
MLPTLVAKPPEGDDWIHEVKLDGYRSQIVINGPDVRIYTRRGLDWSAEYRDLVEAAKALDVETAIVDGETIVTNDAGLPDFAALRRAITRRQHDLYFVAYDGMAEDQKLYRERPRIARRPAGEGKPAFALMGEPGTRKYVGSAFITLNREMRERLWKRVQEHAGPAPEGVKRQATTWVKPGLKGHVKHLRGEDKLRHASLLRVQEHCRR